MKKFYFSCWLGLFSSALFAQWQQTSGPTCGGDIRDIHMDGNTVYIAGGGGFFKSTNTGATWQPVNDGLVNPFAWAVTVKGNTVFAGTDLPTMPTGVYASTNGGASWNLKNIGLTKTSVTTFAVDGAYLYAGTWGGGVSTSTNNAQTWTAANNGLPVNSLMLAFSANNGTVLCSTYWDGVYRTTNNGASWAPAAVSTATGMNGPRIRCFATLGSTIFAGSQGTGYMYKSTDNGVSWTLSDSGINTWINAVEAGGNMLYAGGTSGLFTSSDAGATWVKNTGPLATIFISALAANGSTVYAGTEQGMYVSVDSGANWTLTNYGIATVDTRCLLKHGNNLFAGTYYQKGSFKTSDGGSTWVPLGAGLNDDAEVFAVNGNSLYAGTEMSGIFLSLDNGNTWANQSKNLSGQQLRINDIEFLNNSIFIATQGGGILSSTNGGNWVSSYAGIPGPYVSALALKGNTLYAGTPNGLYNSANNGASWSLCALPTGTNSWVFSVKINGNAIYLGCLDDAALLSTDDGATWSNLQAAGLLGRINDFAFSGDTVYAGNWSLGVFTSTSTGSSWTTFNTGLSQQYVWNLVVDNGYLYAATANQGGVWRTQLPAPTVTNNPAEVNQTDPEAFLFDVYPNPFNESATLVVGQNVEASTMMMTDYLGRVVRTQQVSGNRLTVQKGSLPSGAYIIYLVKEGRSIGQKKIMIY